MSCARAISLFSTNFSVDDNIHYKICYLFGNIPTNIRKKTLQHSKNYNTMIYLPNTPSTISTNSKSAKNNLNLKMFSSTKKIGFCCTLSKRKCYFFKEKGHI